MDASSFEVIMSECLGSARFQERDVQSFTFKCRQCTDIADFYGDSGPKFRSPAWESYVRDQHKGGAAAARWSRCSLAVKDFCRAVKEAEGFLQHHCCTPSGKNDWQLWVKGLVMLDTAEAYDVHLQNLIWSMAALEAAIQLLSVEPPELQEGFIEKVVANCRRDLCARYSSSYKAHRILMDRLDFNESINTLLNASTNAADPPHRRYLEFLLRNSQAAATEGSASAQQPPPTDLPIVAFEISGESELQSSSIKEFELGAGSFSKSVYSTLWLGQIRVAVKVLRVDYSKPDSELEGPRSADDRSDSSSLSGHASNEVFQREISLLARLQSPYIVQFFGWAIEGDNKEGKIVMELVETDLLKLLESPENNNGFPLHVAVDMMLQVCKAMAYVHKQNMIHRDIKPSNILLNRSPVGEFWRVKICDFGISKMKPPEDAFYTTLKQGTAWYRSPEILADQGKYTNKADVYSFAIVCSEMIGGFAASSDLRKGPGPLHNRIVNGQRPFLPANCPAPLSDLIRKCWHTEPEKRPPFHQIASMLQYIRFVLMRGDENAPFLWMACDDYEIKALIADAPSMETIRADATMWNSEALLVQDTSLTVNQSPMQQRHPIKRCLLSGQSLLPGESVICGQYKLTMQRDANLVLLDCNDMICLWTSNCTTRRSFGSDAFRCTLTSRGNLVIHSGSQHIIWSSSSKDRKGSYRLELDFHGHAFIYDSNGATIWATERNALNTGDVLFFNSYLINNDYKLVMQADGNLVLYDQNRATWASGTNRRENHDKCKCTLRDNGLLLVLNDNNVVWSSVTTGHGNASNYKMELQRNGNLVIMQHPSGECIWQTHTDVDHNLLDESDDD